MLSIKPSAAYSASLYAPAIAAFRVAFLTASTWDKTTATDTELAFAIGKWTPDTIVEHALAQLTSRRALDRRGLLRKQEREAREADDAL